MRAMTAVVATLIIGTAAALAQTSPIRPGRWEVAMQMQMANSPVQMPEIKTTQCVTPEQVKDPTSALPRGPQGGGDAKSDCKVANYKVSGNTATWQMSCTTPQPMTATGEIAFTDDTYNGTMKTTLPQGTMTMKMAGKRLGDCDK